MFWTASLKFEFVFYTPYISFLSSPIPPIEVLHLKEIFQVKVNISWDILSFTLFTTDFHAKWWPEMALYGTEYEKWLWQYWMLDLGTGVPSNHPPKKKRKEKSLTGVPARIYLPFSKNNLEGSTWHLTECEFSSSSGQVRVQLNWYVFILSENGLTPHKGRHK